MSLDQEIERLRAIPMFSGMNLSALRLLSFTSERLSLMPGEFLVRQGEVGESAYVILDGEAEVLLDTPDGHRRVAVIGAGHLVGELALLGRGRRSASLRALTALTCLALPKDVFLHLARSLPDFALAVMRELAERLETTTGYLQAERIPETTAASSDGAPQS